MKINGHNVHFKQGSSYDQPKQCIMNGKFFKMTIDLNLTTPVKLRFTHHLPSADMASPKIIMANFVVENHGQDVTPKIYGQLEPYWNMPKTGREPGWFILNLNLTFPIFDHTKDAPSTSFWTGTYYARACSKAPVQLEGWKLIRWSLQPNKSFRKRRVQRPMLKHIKNVDKIDKHMTCPGEKGARVHTA